MKRVLAIILILACLATFTLFAGCGGDDKAGGETAGSEEAVESTESGGEEQVELIDEEGKKITVEESQEEGESDTVIIEDESGEQATIEVEDQAPSEESLGAPIYPGSQYVEGTGISGETLDEKGQAVSMTGATFTTKDAITKVVDWYKGKLGEPMSSVPENTTWMIQGEDGSIVIVVVELSQEGVKITIAKAKGGGVEVP